MRSTASDGPPRVKQLTRGTTFGILVEPKVKKEKKGRRKTIAACYRTPELIKNREVKQRKKKNYMPPRSRRWKLQVVRLSRGSSFFFTRRLGVWWCPLSAHSHLVMLVEFAASFCCHLIRIKKHYTRNHRDPVFIGRTSFVRANLKENNAN